MLPRGCCRCDRHCVIISFWSFVSNMLGCSDIFTLVSSAVRAYYKTEGQHVEIPFMRVTIFPCPVSPSPSLSETLLPMNACLSHHHSVLRGLGLSETGSRCERQRLNVLAASLLSVFLTTGPAAFFLFTVLCVLQLAQWWCWWFFFLLREWLGYEGILLTLGVKSVFPASNNTNGGPFIVAPY